jgi:hypothetical protein
MENRHITKKNRKVHKKNEKIQITMLINLTKYTINSLNINDICSTKRIFLLFKDKVQK